MQGLMLAGIEKHTFSELQNGGPLVTRPTVVLNLLTVLLGLQPSAWN